MAYVRTEWKPGDVVTSDKLNKNETEIFKVSAAIDSRIPDPPSDSGKVLMTISNDSIKRADWRYLPEVKAFIVISAENAAQLYTLIEQLKTAADSAGTKMAAMGIPFSGTGFLENITTYMNNENKVPVIKVSGETALTNKYMSVYSADTSAVSFGYTDMSENTLYEIRFFASMSSLIARVSSCPYTMITD